MSLTEFVEENVLFLIVAVLLAFGIYQTIGLAFGTSVPVVAVISDSMVPTFERGDMVVVRGEPYDRIERGDILVFTHECMPVPVIHRVIDREDSGLVTKGDANTNQVSFCIEERTGACRPATTRTCAPGQSFVNIEEGITADRILGTAWFIIPEIGHLKLSITCIWYNIIGLDTSDSRLSC